MPLVSLVYVSLAAHPMSDDELKEILRVSRTNNAAKTITGMLLYRDGFFIQVLEGEQAPVDATFERIVLDTRHRNVLKIYKMIIEKRMFSEWTMGFNKIADHDMREIEGYAEFLEKPDPLFFAANPDRAHVLLGEFMDRTTF